jgi:hypothetical protein
MITVIAVGLAAMTACLALQSLAGVYAQRRIGLWDTKLRDAGQARRFLAVVAVMLLLAAGTLAQLAAWALLYRVIGAFSSFEEALYFSGVTYTSLGYGDIVIKGDARFLAPMEAMTGLMMFAIVTAILFNSLNRSGGRDS